MAALDQAGRIVDLLASSREPLVFSDIVRRLGLPKSSAHAVLTKLIELGWVETVENGVSRYRVGLRIVELASSRLNDSDAVSRFVGACAQFPGLHDESLVLSVLDGSEVVYLACRNGTRPIGLQYRIGMRLPAAFTASGKAILATYDDDAVTRLLGEDGLAAPTGGRPKTLAELFVELKQIREDGYSIDDEETASGMLCYGAALPASVVFDRPAAVAMSLVKAAVSPRDHHRLAGEITALAAAVR